MTIKDIARECGVSVSTVSRVLNKHPDVSEPVRRKVLRVVEERAYIPNNSARDLVRSRSDAVGVIVRGTGNLFFSSLIKVISRELEARGYTMVLHFIDSDADEVKAGAILEREKKLRESVQKAVDRYHPKLIFIYASCASGIIGDDIDAICGDLQTEYPDTLIIPIHCEGFKSKVCASGFDAAFILINKYILKDRKVSKEKGLINLFAPTTVSYADQKEMERMLELLGAKVNYIPFYSSLEKIKKIPAAEASTSICRPSSTPARRLSLPTPSTATS